MAGMKIKKGDRVKVIAGKDRGVEGEVIRALPARGRVVVEKVNVVRKSMRPTQQNQQGGIRSMEAPVDVSNVQLICPNCSEPTRVAIERDEDGTRHRVCKKCGKRID